MSSSTQNSDLKSQESFDTFHGALGPLRDHLDPIGLLKKGADIDSINSYGLGGDSIYGGKFHSGFGGGTKKFLQPLIHGGNYDHDGYRDKKFFDIEHLDQGLNKYTGHHKKDKYGGKSNQHKDYHDTHVYTRNRGYGYEKHFMFDKEYSTGKSSGRKNGHHSYYGDHDHGSKAGIDAHKNYDLKKYGHKNYNNYDGYDDGPMMNGDYSVLIEPNHNSYNDDGYPSHYENGGDNYDFGKLNLLKHKKEVHQLKKHLENHHHLHQHHKYPELIQPIHLTKVHEYVPVIESYGGVLNPLPKTDSIGSNYNSYGVNSNPFYTNHQSSPIMNSAYSIYPSGEEGVYLSSASDAQKSNIANNSETEGESVNTHYATLLRNNPSLIESKSSPSTGTVSSSTTSHTSHSTTTTKTTSHTSQVIDTSPLISTRKSSSTHSPVISSASSQPNGIIETFDRIQNGVHATPPVIATHLYKSYAPNTNFIQNNQS
ncbi:secreted salivary gland peptide [Sarcoptes scabiei]|nr:secreted salivary gland peptide [Sarcoptes scabiei]